MCSPTPRQALSCMLHLLVNSLRGRYHLPHRHPILKSWVIFDTFLSPAWPVGSTSSMPFPSAAPLSSQSPRPWVWRSQPLAWSVEQPPNQTPHLYYSHPLPSLLKVRFTSYHTAVLRSCCCPRRSTACRIERKPILG